MPYCSNNIYTIPKSLRAAVQTFFFTTAKWIIYSSTSETNVNKSSWVLSFYELPCGCHARRAPELRHACRSQCRPSSPSSNFISSQWPTRTTTKNSVPNSSSNRDAQRGHRGRKKVVRKSGASFWAKGRKQLARCCRTGARRPGE